MSRREERRANRRQSPSSLLAYLISVSVVDDPDDIIHTLIATATDPSLNDAQRAAFMGDALDDAVEFDGVIGDRLEGIDDVLAEQLAGMMFGLIRESQDRAREAAVEWLTDQLGQAADLLEGRGVPPELVEQLKGLLDPEKLKSAA